jgi:hypothetical protein
MDVDVLPAFKPTDEVLLQRALAKCLDDGGCLQCRLVRIGHAAARCIVCHRYGEDGGATGPDLTQAAGRFQLQDLVEAMVHLVLADHFLRQRAMRG